MEKELALLYEALGKDLGMIVQTSNVQLCLQRFYKARRESGDPELMTLQFRRSPKAPHTELWIVKGKKPIPSTPPPPPDKEPTE